MTRRPAAKAAFIVLAFVALAFVPLATADHAYSHRYVVWGRVIDANNNPVPGVTVDLGTEKPFNPEGPCVQQPGTETEAYGPARTSPVTNQFGEFTFCYHHHSMSRGTPGTAILRIDSLGVEKHIEFDGYMRYSYIVVQLESAQPTANTTIFDSQYTVQGRAWRASGSDIRVETVRVYGDTVHNKPVNLTFTYNGKDPIQLNTTTNNYGDYAIRVPITERVTSGTVTMVIENETFTRDLDTTTGITYIRAELPTPKDPFVAKFLIGLGIVAAVTVGGGAIWFASNRVKTARDERVVREHSARKRSNK